MSILKRELQEAIPVLVGTVVVSLAIITMLAAIGAGTGAAFVLFDAFRSAFGA